jgi:hypothetical protein
MAHLEDIRDATERVEQAKRLIVEAQSARQQSEPLVRTVQDDIEGTRRVSSMMASLAHLIDSMDDGPSFA